MSIPSLYAVTDIETTGLVPGTDYILEISCKVINRETKVLGEFHSLVWDFESLAHLDRFLESSPYVRNMHRESGLLDALKQLVLDDDLEEHSLDAVEARFRDFLKSFEGNQLYIMGSSVKFDWGFLAQYMPTVLKQVHYRVADVSSTRVQMEAITGEDWAYPKKKNHRASADVDETIAEFKWLWRKFADWCRGEMHGISQQPVDLWELP